MATKNGSEPSIAFHRTLTDVELTRLLANGGPDDGEPFIKPSVSSDEHNDRFNYAILIALYTLQGIPMGLSASIPFLIQQKLKAVALAALPAAESAITSGATSAAAARLSYNANAIFALCSWPFSLKLLWAPIVDSCYHKGFGRRKSWLVPAQGLAGLLMVFGSSFVERQLGLGNGIDSVAESFNVKGITVFFFALYFLMATQDIAVDGWALTMLSKKNRGRGPVCNSIGQNIGYFLSFVGFLALNDAESSETLWRPLFGLKSKPEIGLVSLGGFIRFMGYFILVLTTAVAVLKHEVEPVRDNDRLPRSSEVMLADDAELDASEIGLKETYHRLWAVCQLPAVRWLFLILLTYRLPTALADNVKFLKAVELGLSKSTTALLSPTVILPLGILVPIVATKIWNGHPLRQFMTAYKIRVTLGPLLDICMLLVLQQTRSHNLSGNMFFWTPVILSTALQAIVNSLQFNSQMTFFASRVDPAIGGSYMTLLNTAANLGGTWPASFVMWLTGVLTRDPECIVDATTGIEVCTGGRDPYYVIQGIFSILGCVWILALGNRVRRVAELPDDAWRTHLLDEKDVDEEALTSVDVEISDSLLVNRWMPKEDGKRE
jgi:PAT family acetyl-CoA transporter-like MFS transporter 1